MFNFASPAWNKAHSRYAEGHLLRKRMNLTGGRVDSEKMKPVLNTELRTAGLRGRNRKPNSRRRDEQALLWEVEAQG